MYLIEIAQFMAFLIVANLILRFAALKLSNTRFGDALAFVA